MLDSQRHTPIPALSGGAGGNSSPKKGLTPIFLADDASASCAYKLGLLGLFALCYGLFYVYPNFNQWIEPRSLLLLAIDRATPFLPWTFLIYFSEYLLIAFTIFKIDQRRDFNVFAGHAFIVLFFIGSIFYVFPTIYPRPVYPDDAQAIVAFALMLIKNADAPTNCFPSMHVAITSVVLYALRMCVSKTAYPMFVLWGVAIFASTMTTKQHYSLDILAGLTVAYLVIVVHRRLCNRNPLSTDRSVAPVNA